MTQMLKNLPAVQETWVWSLDWDDPMEEGMATHSSILAWRFSMNRRNWQATVYEATKSWHNWANKHTQKWVHGSLLY